MTSTQAQADLVTVTIDGTPVRVPKGTLLVEAAKQIRREIPVYCYHPKMGPAGLCRICLVEIEGMPKLQIACNTPVSDGMVVHTESDLAAGGRRSVLELYLKNHPLDCPICDKGGECDLQDYAMAYGQGASRVADPKESKPKAVDLGPTIVLDEERCVVCQRCVRFDEIISGDRQLVLKDRGVRNIIATSTGDAYRHNFTGNVTELCPVGALTSKTYRFRSRPWDLKRVETACTQCSVGCRQFVDTRAGTIARTMSVEADDAISDGWLCDRGRYNIGFVDSSDRIVQPLYRRDGQWNQITWDDAFALWAGALRDALRDGGADSIGVIGGGRLLNEEAYLLQTVFRGIGTTNIDWRAGEQVQASPGSGGGNIESLERAEAIVIVGESPAERAPVLDLRVRKAVREGAKLVRIASVDARPPSAFACVDVSDVARAVTSIGKVGRLAIVWDGVDSNLARETLAAFPGALTFVASEQGNARGAEALGVHPAFAPGFVPTARGKDTSEMLRAAAAGNMRVLSLIGVNPALNYPNGSIVERALERTPFVVVSDLFLTNTARKATLVLPARSSFEKSGTTTALDGTILPVNAAIEVDPVPDALTDGEMLVGLARAMDLALPSLEEVETAVFAALTHARQLPELGEKSLEFAAPAFDPSKRERDALEVIVRSRILAGGGTMAHDSKLAQLEALPQVALSPYDARELNLETGDYVDLQAGERTVHDLLVEVRTDLGQGKVVLTRGLADAPANGLGSSTATIVNVRKAEGKAG
ncbi:MAG: molybdopterin-dependent oxidoreductase [Candidatus Eremiobacteraeota bacterium]|nr:molybdopterin-dependent oxidoreductase [Candidatus Eremiobacteraeota bacterium]